MIEISYTLHGDGGGIEYQERRSPQVPHIGELITLEQSHSYQVVDVLWHLDEVGRVEPPSPPANATGTSTSAKCMLRG